MSADEQSPIDTATLFYGGAHAPPTDTSTTTEGDEPVDLAEVLYGDPSMVIKRYEPQLRDATNAMADRTGMSAEDAQAHVERMALVYHDARIETNAAGQLHALVARHSGQTADPDTLTEWSTESRREIRERYPKDGPQRLEAVRAFIAARPGLGEELDRTGLGSHPRFVMALMENADRLRAPRKR